MEHMNRRDFPGAGLGTMMGAPLLLARTGAPLDTELKNGEQNRQTAAKALWRHRFGVNYTPTQNWLFFWNDFDADSVARDLDAIAALGMDHFRILAMWPYFQPNRTWVSPGHLNRVIGDEQLPEDSERLWPGTLKCWPQWLLDGKPSPTGRYSFCDYRLWKKNDTLVQSGLLGPVSLKTAQILTE